MDDILLFFQKTYEYYNKGLDVTFKRCFHINSLFTITIYGRNCSGLQPRRVFKFMPSEYMFRWQMAATVHSANLEKGQITFHNHLSVSDSMFDIFVLFGLADL